MASQTTTQTSLRLPADLLTQIDDLVASGEFSGRADLITRACTALMRERRIARDEEILRAHDGRPYPDLDAMHSWLDEREGGA
ncbi:MAG: ribbon-helix-helix domain-containing protein [Sporichthyaceae bacterium]